MDVDGAPARNPAAGDRVLVALNKAEAFGIPLGRDAFWTDGKSMYYVDGPVAQRAFPQSGQISQDVSVQSSYSMEYMLTALAQAGKTER